MANYKVIIYTCPSIESAAFDTNPRDNRLLIEERTNVTIEKSESN